MHRSLTLSEIVSSTLSNKNNDEVDDEFSRDKFFTNIGIGLIELLFSSLILCYGIIFAKNVGTGTYTIEDGLWPTILYISTYHITAPWSKLLVGEWFEIKQNQNFMFRIIVFISTCLLMLGMVLSRFMVCYGICGGLAHRIVSTQLRFIATKKYNMEEKKIECNVQSAKAICLLILPHILLLLVDNYSIAQSFLIYAAILLNIIPASWIIRHPKDSEDSIVYPDMSRYQTLSVFSRQMEEMREFSNSPNSTSFKIAISDSSSEEEQGEKEDEEEEKEITKNDANPHQFFKSVENDYVDEQLPKIKQLTHETVQFYYSNMGVNILPDIPEEPEIETERDLDSANRNTIDSKRLSRISAALEELNKENEEKVIVKESIITTHLPVKIFTVNNTVDIKSNEYIHDNAKLDRIGALLEEHERKETVKKSDVTTDTLVKVPVVAAADEIKSIEYIQDIYSNNERNLFKNFHNTKNNCCRCSPYTLFIWKRRFRRLKDVIADYFFQPLYHALRDLHFYPTLVSKTTILLSSTIFITLAPYVFLRKNSDYKNEDTVFLLSYMAFSWCLFLVFLPLVVTFSKVKMRYTYVIGLLFTAFSMLLLSKRRMTNDLITWSCLLFGFGFGMVNYSENLVYKSFLKGRKPESSEGTLDIISGLSVILAYYFITYSELDIVRIFPMVVFYAHVIIAGFWVLLSIPKIFKTPLRKYQRNDLEGSILD